MTIRQNVESALDLLLCVLVRDATQGHVLLAIQLCERLLAGDILSLVSNLVALLLVSVSLVFLNESLLVFNFHVHGVVH